MGICALNQNTDAEIQVVLGLEKEKAVSTLPCRKLSGILLVVVIVASPWHWKAALVLGAKTLLIGHPSNWLHRQQWWFYGQPHQELSYHKDHLPAHLGELRLWCSFGLHY